MPRPPRSVAIAYAILAVVMLAWAGNAIVGRAAREAVPPFTLAFVRWSGALLILMPFALRPLRRDAATLRAHWRIVLLLGLLGVASFNALLYLALHTTTATNAILIQAAIPPLVLVANALVFADRPPAGQIAGVTLSTLGVLLVVTHADIGTLRALSFARGDLYVLCAVLAWSFYTVLLRKRPAVEPVSFLAVTFAIGAAAMLPLALAEEMRGAAIVWGPRSLGAFAYVAVLPSLLAYFLYNKAVTMIGPARAGQTTALMPVFGSLLAAAILGEPLHAYHLVGLALILVGIAVAAFAARAPRAP